MHSMMCEILVIVLQWQKIDWVAGTGCVIFMFVVLQMITCYVRPSIWESWWVILLANEVVQCTQIKYTKLFQDKTFLVDLKFFTFHGFYLHCERWKHNFKVFSDIGPLKQQKWMKCDALIFSIEDCKFCYEPSTSSIGVIANLKFVAIL